MTETVIRVEHVSKAYRLGVVTSRTLVQDTQRWWARWRGEPDPVSRVGGGDGRAVKSEPDTVWALRDLSLDVSRGEVLGIIGRNGAGKSTLLKILSRVTAPTEGSVKIKGRIASLLEVGTGFHPELTGRENVYLNGAILGMTKAEIRSKFDEMTEFSGCSRYIDTPVKRYSSGMVVRLAFSVAAHFDPEILIVDEVLAVGDIAFQQKCIGRMQQVAGQDRTVLFVSHNLGAVSRLCGRAAYLVDGTLDAVGPTDGIIARYMRASAGRLASLNLPYEAAPVTVRAFGVTDSSGVETSVYSTGETIRVTLACSLSLPEPQLRIGFDVVSLATQDVLFRSFDDDREDATRDPGEYRLVCDVPAHLLLPGGYRIRLQIEIHDQRWLVDGELYRDISVVLTDGVNRRYADRRPGVIAPGLNWRREWSGEPCRILCR